MVDATTETVMASDLRRTSVASQWLSCQKQYTVVSPTPRTAEHSRTWSSTDDPTLASASDFFLEHTQPPPTTPDPSDGGHTTSHSSETAPTTIGVSTASDVSPLLLAVAQPGQAGMADSQEAGPVRCTRASPQVGAVDGPTLAVLCFSFQPLSSSTTSTEPTISSMESQQTSVSPKRLR